MGCSAARPSRFTPGKRTSEAEWAPVPVWTRWQRYRNPCLAPAGNPNLILQLVT